MSDHESDGSRHGSPPIKGEIPRGKLLPLISRRLTTVKFKKIAEGLGLPTTGSADEIRQLIEGKLEEGHNVHNVQVVMNEATTVCHLWTRKVCFWMLNHSRKKLRKHQKARRLCICWLKPSKKVLNSKDLEETREMLSKEQERTAQLADELSAVKATTTAATEVAELQTKLKIAQEKAKQVWRLNCTQSREQEELLATKDDCIAKLEAEIKPLKAIPRVSPHSGSGASSPDGFETERSSPVALETTTPQPRHMRRGKAPPVKPFTGEDPAVKLDDWLPILRRASLWNG